MTTFNVINNWTAYEAALLSAGTGRHIEDLIEQGVITCPAEFQWTEEEISKYMPRARRFLKQRGDGKSAHDAMLLFVPGLYKVYMALKQPMTPVHG